MKRSDKPITQKYYLFIECPYSVLNVWQIPYFQSIINQWFFLSKFYVKDKSDISDMRLFFSLDSWVISSSSCFRYLVQKLWPTELVYPPEDPQTRELVSSHLQSHQYKVPLMFQVYVTLCVKRCCRGDPNLSALGFFGTGRPKLDVPKSNIPIIWTSIFEWCMVRCRCKNGHQKDMCLKEIGLYVSNKLIISNLIINMIRKTYVSNKSVMKFLLW